jgi:D-sedoheptulose 7-phosphate isomerase
MEQKSLATYQGALNHAFLQVDESKINKVINSIRVRLDSTNTIWLIGNGGSAATASHFSVDLSKGSATRLNKTLKAIPLMDLVPIQSAWSNDDSYEIALTMVFKNFAEEGDLLFAISGSGNSVNILNTLIAAQELGVEAVGLTGFSGGQMSGLVDIEVNVPSNDMQIIEDVHHAICHFISREI